MRTLQTVMTRPRTVINASTCSTDKTSSSITVRIISTASSDPAKNAMCLTAKHWKSPKSIMPTFTETSQSHKHKQRQIIKSWSFSESRGHKSWKLQIQPTRHIETFATKSVKTPRQMCLCCFSPLQCTKKVGDKVHDFDADFDVDTNHKNWQHDLCRRLSWFVSATKLRTLSQSQHNGIQA